MFWGLYVFLSLVTHTPTDPSLNHITTKSYVVQNSAGILGAYLSGFLNDVFGIAAYIWPLVFGAVGVAFLMPTYELLWWRWLGYFLLTVCLLFVGAAFNIRLGTIHGGGMVGATLFSHAARALNPWGSVILWLFLFTMAAQLAFGISWVQLYKNLLAFWGKRLKNLPQLALPQKTSEEQDPKPRVEITERYSEESQENVEVSGESKNFKRFVPRLHVSAFFSGIKAFFARFFARKHTEVMPEIYDIEPVYTTDDPHISIVPYEEVQDFEMTTEQQSPDEGDMVHGIVVPVKPLDLVEPLEPVEPAEPQEPAAKPRAVPEVSITPPVKKVKPPKMSFPFPPHELLQAAPEINLKNREARQVMEQKGEALMACLENFGIHGELVRITPGPVVTMYAVRPAAGTRVNKISNLNDDIALSLKAISIRIQAPIPGSDTVGIEIPNDIREMVNFREILQSLAFSSADGPLKMIIGKNIAGKPYIAELSKMPHLLVAGATGAGKSVGLNTILLSLLYTNQPDEMQLLLIDPKRIEMAVYADLPHLVHPVVTEMQHAKTALEWAVHEMDRRYECMARLGVRNIIGYNQKLRTLDKEYPQQKPVEIAELEQLPYLVIIIDELADLMLTAAREVETSIVRLAQLARAAGIHMILATQRPSVDVVTGIIKANFPCRISFQVTSKHDSRTILDMVGAEHLLGKGDMLFKPSGGKLQRLHGPFVHDEEVQSVVEYWKSLAPPNYTVDFSAWGSEQSEAKATANIDTGGDALYAEVLAFVEEQGKVSISLVQRRFKIGFNKAALMVEQLERDGIVGPADGSKPRTLLNR